MYSKKRSWTISLAKNALFEKKCVFFTIFCDPVGLDAHGPFVLVKFLSRFSQLGLPGMVFIIYQGAYLWNKMSFLMTENRLKGYAFQNFHAWNDIIGLKRPSIDQPIFCQTPLNEGNKRVAPLPKFQPRRPCVKGTVSNIDLRFQVFCFQVKWHPYRKFKRPIINFTMTNSFRV